MSLIDKGAHGNVYVNNDNTIVKKIFLFKNNCIYSPTLRELIAYVRLSGYDCSHMIKCLAININGDYVNITLENGGYTLTNWLDRSSLHKHPENFMRIFKHLIIFLDHIQRLKLVHGDLKPDNIVIKKYAKTIDFGGTFPFNSTTSLCMCTVNFRDPNLSDTHCQYSDKNDIFSIALILAYMISKKYFIDPKTISYQYDKFVEVIKNCTYISNPLKNLIIKMGDIDSNNRPSCNEIYTFLDIDHNCEYTQNIEGIDMEDITNIDYIDSYIKFFLDSVKVPNFEKYFSICQKNIYKYIFYSNSIKNIQSKKEEFLVYTAICLYVVISFFDDIQICFDEMYVLLDKKYTIDEIKSMIVNFLDVIKFCI